MTENENDQIRTSDLYDKHQTYFKSINQDPVFFLHMGTYIKKIFDNKVRYHRTSKYNSNKQNLEKDPRISYYKFFQERDSSEEEMDDEEVFDEEHLDLENADQVSTKSYHLLLLRNYIGINSSISSKK